VGNPSHKGAEQRKWYGLVSVAAAQGTKEYLVKWKGFADAENTWEPEVTIHT
jgi:hypothetical protein